MVKIEQDVEKVNSTDFDTKDKFDYLNTVENKNSEVSAFLTIQEGCDKFCKFCVVPYTRGAEFSRSINELISECKDLANKGTKEIILLGQNVNAFNFKGKMLSDLIFEISKIESIKRIRYTTSHPIDFTDDLIKAHGKSDKLMPLIHLPVQSGSNKILKNMNRKHTVEEYIELIKKLKKENPLLRFSSDFIIGYPGETENDFEDTLNLIEKIQFINCFSFIYSPRPGTPASQLKQIKNEISKKKVSFISKKSRNHEDKL